MANAWDDEGNENEEQPDNSPAGLRKAVEKANKKATDAATALAAMQQENATLKARNKISELLTKQGIDAGKFTAHVPTDVEPTEETIKAWVESNKDTYNFGTATASTGSAPTKDGEPAGEAQQEQASTDPLQGIDPTLVDNLIKMGVLSDRASAVSGSEKKQLQEQLSAAKPKSLEDAKDMLKGLGIEVQDTGGYNDQFFAPARAKAS